MSKQIYTNLINPNLQYNSTSGNVTNPLTVELDCGQNNIINLAPPVNANDAVTLAYYQANLPSSTGGIENPLTENLNANNFEINNVSAISTKDAIDTLVTYYVQTGNGSIITSNASDATDVHLHVAINQAGVGKPYYTDFRAHPVTNLLSVGFNDGGIISKNSSTFQFNQPLDVNNNYIKDVQNIQFFNAPSLEIDLSNNLLYDDSIVVTAGNINNYVSQATWQGTAGSNLEMNQYDVNLGTGDINLDSGKIYFQDTNSLSVANNDLLFNGGSVLSVQSQIVDSYSLTDSTPGTAQDAYDAGAVILLNASNDEISNTGDWENPIIEFNINIVPTAGQAPLDLSNEGGLIEIVASNLPNPLNGSSLSVYMSAKQTVLQLNTDGSYTLSFRTDNVPSGINNVTSWSDIFTHIGSSVYFAVFASLFPTGTVQHYYVNATATMQVLQNIKTITNNEMLIIGNQNQALQSYYVSPKTLITQSSNSLYVYSFYPTFSNDTIYFKTVLLGTRFCVKLSGCIFDGAIVESTVSSLTVYNLGNVLTNVSLSLVGFYLQCSFDWDITYDPSNSHYIVTKTKILSC